MNNDTFEKIKCLENKAEKALEKLMNRFDQGNPSDQGICCPWLRWQRDKDRTFKPKGLLLMQDWGNVKQHISGATGEIATAAEKGDGERTLINLFAKPDWKKAIVKGEWWVSNAVWGLRLNGKGKCGYLGDPTHRAAFPIWLELLAYLSEGNPKFVLVVAGEWAVFKNEILDNDLQAYLKRWYKWYSIENEKNNGDELSSIISQCEGSLHHVHHPATWTWKPDLIEGPPVG